MRPEAGCAFASMADDPASRIRTASVCSLREKLGREMEKIKKGGPMDTIKALIEKRAYQLFLDRGGQHGYHIEDWLQAEREIMARNEKKPPKAAVRPGAKTTPSSRRPSKS